MDAFESLVRLLMEKDGYWTVQSHKVNVTKEEKRAIGKPSIPRPEVDLLALDLRLNRLIALEVKSYLDSPGVDLALLREQHSVPEGRYKLFTCANYRSIVLARLLGDLRRRGLVNNETELQLGLAAGNVKGRRTADLKSYFSSQGWYFLGPDEIKSKLRALSEADYENDPFVISAKLALR
ncbi:MAG: hypothetical protein J0L76_13660 [Rhodobacterales bacterium]|nr:hypothetical protein [Rhodobacterales bacterium]